MTLWDERFSTPDYRYCLNPNRFLVEAASQTWASQVARPCGRKRAMVALARRIGVILQRLWIDGTAFRAEAPIISQAA